jgi:hypothetical protein
MRRGNAPVGQKECLYGVKPRLEIRERTLQLRCAHHLDLICPGRGEPRGFSLSRLNENNMNIQDEYTRRIGLYEEYTLNQMVLLEKALETTGHKKGSRLQNLSTLICQVTSFASSVVTMSRNERISEAYLLSRCVLDTSINCGYMLICDQDEYDRFVDFSSRNIGRGIETRAKAFEAIGKSLDVPNIRTLAPFKEVFDKFMSPKKRVDLTKWETEKSSSIDKKLETIRSKVPGFNAELFEAARLFIYEDASEIAHGTLYGSTLSTGVFYGRATFDSALDYAFGIIRTLYLLIGSLIGSLLLVINKIHQIEEILVDSRRNFDKLGRSLPG